VDTIENAPQRRRWFIRLSATVGMLFGVLVVGALVASRSDGPVFVFAGGPLRSGNPVEFSEMDWALLDEQHEFEVEIVGAESSRTLWFSVYEGVPYVACDLDCVDGLLSRWPQQIERDNRVVVRIDEMLVEGHLIHVPHGTKEYVAARAARELKYSGNAGGRAATETAAHSAVVELGEVITGRSKRKEPGDRLFRVAPR
jgi:hypothetical protein